MTAVNSLDSYSVAKIEKRIIPSKCHSDTFTTYCGGKTLLSGRAALLVRHGSHVGLTLCPGGLVLRGFLS